MEGEGILKGNNEGEYAVALLPLLRSFTPKWSLINGLHLGAWNNFTKQGLTSPQYFISNCAVRVHGLNESKIERAKIGRFLF